MRIVVCDYSGHPFQVQLSRQLARNGHAVLHLHFAGFQTPKGSLGRLPGDPRGFSVEGINLERKFDKRQFLKRRFLEAKVGNLIAARALEFAPDVVIGCNMPLDAQKRLSLACRRHGARFVFWLQDVYSKAIRHYLSAKLGLIGQVIGGHYDRLEGRLLRSSDAVIAISDSFRGPLAKWGVRRRAVHVIPNWAPLSEIYPVRKDNAWARSNGLHDRTVALYTGTLGLKHDPALLLDLAKSSAKHGIEVVVTSEGAGAEWLTAAKARDGVTNLTILPFQPMELYPEVLGTGDILLAMIDEEAAIFSVPSKILSYLASGRAIVASIPGNNEAAFMVARSQAGRIVKPGDTAGFCDAVLTLASDRQLRETCSRNARALAESRFDIESITERFEAIFASIIEPVPMRQDGLLTRPKTASSGI